jgi:hypothetical protein
MSITGQVRRATALGIALAISAAAQVAAQDTTRRPVSEQRIPVKKDQTFRQESRGEVELAAERAKIDALESTAAALRQRIDLMETDVSRLRSRSYETDRVVSTLRDSLRMVNEELVAVQNELAVAIARHAALAQDVQRVDRRVTSLRYGSLFGHSGFYVGLGTGGNVATGTLHSIGYRAGLGVVLPFGWSKPDKLLGIRAELGLQSFEGRTVPHFVNRDPMLYTATAMATLNLPINTAKTNFFYLMGGGGAFIFHRYGDASALNDRLEKASPATKFGVTGGLGLELHILGATSLFVQSQITNVFANGSQVSATNDSRNLRWVPVMAGITLR